MKTQISLRQNNKGVIEHTNGENATYVSRVANRGILDYEIDVTVSDWEDEFW